VKREERRTPRINPQGKPGERRTPKINPQGKPGG